MKVHLFVARAQQGFSVMPIKSSFHYKNYKFISWHDFSFVEDFN